MSEGHLEERNLVTHRVITHGTDLVHSSSEGDT